MLFGLSGASGTGKSTLAKLVSERTKIPFVPASITSLAAAAGYKAVGKLSLRDRLDMQEKMLLSYWEIIRNIEGHAILDRTPIDMIGYMMAELHMHSYKGLDQTEIERVEKFTHRCKLSAAAYFDHVFATGMLPDYEVAETRPADNRAYQHHVQLIIYGALTESSRIKHSIFLSTDLEERAGYMQRMIEERVAKTEERRRSSRFIH